VGVGQQRPLGQALPARPPGQAQYDMVAGLEDLTVDASGQLWGLSESGTRKYMSWEMKFPFIFKIDTGKLK
jgi:hypothetical protein